VSRWPSGASSSVATNATTTTGTLIRNTEPHQKCCSSQPPMIGPSAAPTIATEPQIAMAMLRSRASWKLRPISASVAGIIAAAPTARKRARQSAALGVGERRCQRCHAEHHQADQEHAAVADAVAQRARAQQQAGHHQRIGVDDPQRLAGTGREFFGQRGQAV
jgi:hypothetical protein